MVYKYYSFTLNSLRTFNPFKYYRESDIQSFPPSFNFFRFEQCGKKFQSNFFQMLQKTHIYVIQSSFNPLTIKASPVTFRGTCDDPVLVNICTNKSLSLSASTTDDKANTTLFACALNRILVLNSV